MEKIAIRDLLKIRFIENLQYSPDGRPQLSYLQMPTKKRTTMSGMSGS